jgi:dihydrofolate synthase/folylpolyglutamate synthase
MFTDLYQRGMSKGNQHLADLIAGAPELKCNFKFIHVGGTNGKGSVCQYIFQSLKNNGKSVSKFTSPHLFRINERFENNKGFICDNLLNELRAKLESLIDCEKLTLFEYLVLIFVLWSNRLKVDYAIIEVGLGGHLDTTNILEGKCITAITSISKDHTNILGDNPKGIAHDKSLICRPDIPMFLPEEIKEMDVIARNCQQSNSPLKIVPTHLDFKTLPHHQQVNASLATAICKYLGVIEKTSVQSILNLRLPCRLEHFKEQNVLMDVCHNPAGIQELINFIKSNQIKINKVYFSIMKDKDVNLIFKKLCDYFAEVIFVELDSDRALKTNNFPESFREKVKTVKLEDFKKGIQLETDCAICGTFQLLGEIEEFRLSLLPKETH